MAKCFTVAIGPQRAAAAKKYFDRFSVLPPKNLRVNYTREIPGPVSFEKFLDYVVKDKAVEFVFVIHGYNDGSGFYLPLANGSQSTKTKKDKIKTLNEIADKKGGKISPEDKKKLSLSEVQIKRLLVLRSGLHAKKIKKIEFRGCNLGRDNQSVKEFRLFFGAASFGAPKLYSFFGNLPIKSGKSLVINHSNSHSGLTETYPYEYNGKKCFCCLGLNQESKPVNGHVVGEDDPTLDMWIQDNLSAKATKGKDSQIPVHGLWVMPGVAPSMFGGLIPGRPIFPLAKNANKQTEYNLNMVYSP